MTPTFAPLPLTAPVEPSNGTLYPNMFHLDRDDAFRLESQAGLRSKDQATYNIRLMTSYKRQQLNLS